MSYKRVRKNFVTGLWTADMVKVAYRKGIITADQYKEIIALPHDGGEDEE